MATIPTNLGPIGVRQVNNSLYVGHSDLTTIQAAVTMAAKIGGVFTIIVPLDYAGSDAISALTGATANMLILDQRSGQSQVYFWNGTQFVPEAFIQDAGFISLGPPAYFPQGSAAFYFYPAGTSGVGTAHLDFYANPGQVGMPALNIVGTPSDGSPLWTFLRCDQDALENPRIQIPSAVEVYTPAGVNNYNMWIGANRDQTGAQGMSIWGRPSANAIDLQGETLVDDSTSGAYNQAIRLNYLGGNVLLGPVVTVDALGDITGVNHLTAVDAQFATCEVEGSPVRTFANTAEGEGPSFPPVGIAVSTGSAWDTSLNPANVARSIGTTILDPALIYLATNGGGVIGANPGNPTRIGGDVGQPATVIQHGGALDSPAITQAGVPLATYPPAGVAVSTGTAWGAAIPAADVARLSVANTFTAAQTFAAVSAGPLTARSGLVATGFIPTPSTQGGIYAGLGSDAASPVITWIDSGAPADAKVWTATAFGNSTLNFICFNDALTANNPWMTVTRIGAVPSLISMNAALSVAGAANLLNGLAMQGTPTTFPITANSLRLSLSGSTVFYDMAGGSTTTQGDGWFRTFSSNASLSTQVLHLISTGITAAVPFNAAAGTVSAGLSVGGGAAGATANTLRLWTQSSGATYLDFLGASSSSQASFQMRSSTSGGETVSGVLLCYSNLFSILVNTTVTGNFYASGTITSGGAKGFRITHPLDDTKDLMHVAVEGPECAVFYRGESVTAGGWAEVSLPDYFEALTMPTDRTVQLTTLFEEDDEPIGPMAASRVKDGKFRVWSAVPAQKFYWEVKAVRADIAPLEVKIDRGTQHTGGEKNDEGTDRIGAREN